MPHRPSRTLAVPFVLAFVAILCWAASATFATGIGKSAQIPIAVVVAQVAGVLTLVIGPRLLRLLPRITAPAGGLHSFIDWVPRSKQQVAYVLLFLGYQYCYYYALNTMNPFGANAINYLWPLLLPIFLLGPLQALRQPARLLVLIAAFCATLLIIIPDFQAFKSYFAQGNVGVLCAFLAAVLAAGYMSIGARILDRATTAHEYISFYKRNYLAGSIISSGILLSSYAFGVIGLADVSAWQAILSGLALGIASLGIGHVFWQAGLVEAAKRGRVHELPLLAFLIPVLSALILYVTNRQLLGHDEGLWLGVIVVVGLVVISVSATNRLPAPIVAYGAFFVTAMLIFFTNKYVRPFYQPVFTAIDKSISQNTFQGTITLFAILVAFLLQRGWEKSIREGEKTLRVSQAIRGLYERLVDGAREDAYYVATAFRKFFDVFFVFLVTDRRWPAFLRGEEAEERLQQLRRCIWTFHFENTPTSGASDGDERLVEDELNLIERQISELRMMRADAVSHWERSLVTAIGIIAILASLAELPQTLPQILFVVFFSSGIAYLIARVNELAAQPVLAAFERVMLITAPYTRFFKYHLIPDRDYPIPVALGDGALIFPLQFIDSERGSDVEFDRRRLGRGDRLIAALKYGVLLAAVAGVLIILSGMALTAAP